MAGILTYIIAEIGGNHNGSPETARRLIDAAAEAGADAVKFQKRDVPACIPPDQRAQIRKTPWGEMRYDDYRERLEFSWEELAGIRVYARARGLDCFLSVWDVESARGVTPEWGRVKIPSAKITDADLLSAVRDLGLPVIISTAMSTEAEIEAAVRWFGGQDLTIMHCHGAYPAPSHELNLRVIPKLKARYPAATIGYSGHEYGIATTVWAVTLGAETIERHITLDRESWGSDQSSSLEPAVFAKMVRHIRSAEQALGDGEKIVHESELAKLKSLRG